jgi:hypothetical protein
MTRSSLRGGRRGRGRRVPGGCTCRGCGVRLCVVSRVRALHPADPPRGCVVMRPGTGERRGQAQPARPARPAQPAQPGLAPTRLRCERVRRAHPAVVLRRWPRAQACKRGDGGKDHANTRTEQLCRTGRGQAATPGCDGPAKLGDGSAGMLGADRPAPPTREPSRFGARAPSWTSAVPRSRPLSRFRRRRVGGSARDLIAEVRLAARSGSLEHVLDGVGALTPEVGRTRWRD